MLSDPRSQQGVVVQAALTALLHVVRWPDGRALTDAQRQHAMRAVITWGELHLPAEARVGFIDKGHKAGEVCDELEPIAWKESQHE